MRLLSSAPRRWRQLSSNVRQHKKSVRSPSRKCACRRELNSHESAKHWGRDLSEAKLNTPSLVNTSICLTFGRAGVTAGQLKRKRSPSAAARRLPQRASRKGIVARMSERRPQSMSSLLNAVMKSQPGTNSVAPGCKAQSAMQGTWRAPQTRGTATALAVARIEKQNDTYAKTVSLSPRHSAA